MDQSFPRYPKSATHFERSTMNTQTASDAISCKGIRTHNLKNIDLEIPKGKWVCITGVSGSGKSSFAFDTLFAESQRRFLETLGTYERQFLEGLPQGEFDSIDNIPPAIALKQSNKASDPRSVIASAADLNEPFRLLFSLTMEPSCSRCGEPVTTSQSQDLVTAIEKSFEDRNIHAIILGVNYRWPEEIERSISIAKTLLSDGYSRVIANNNIHSIEDIIGNNSPLSGESVLVLDRIGAESNRDELQNRTLTAWSQVRYSSQFQTLKMIPIDKSSKPDVQKILNFETQPFCTVCNSSTTLIQQGDLDWQSALGACKKCEGIGNVPVVDINKVIPDPNKSLSEGAIKPWSSTTFRWMSEELEKTLNSNGIQTKVPYKDLPKNVIDWIWSGTDTHSHFSKKSSDTINISEFFSALEAERYKSSSRILLAKYRSYVTCSDCQGTRLRENGRNAKCCGMRFQDLMNMEISSVHSWLDVLSKSKRFLEIEEKVTDIFAEVQRKISTLIRLGLGSSTLWRRCKTLSGGEYQRVLLSRVLGNGLTDALYVLDEPSVGLGKTELLDLANCLRELRDLGNTVVMVEHDRFLIESADLWIELGPGGGSHGGKILAKTSTMPRSASQNFPPEDSLTNANKKRHEKKTFEKLHFQNFSALNCHNISTDIPLGCLTVISGPSGAGKSTLLHMGIDAALDLAREHQRFSNTNSDIDRRIGTWEKFHIPKNFFETTEIVSIEQKAAHRSIASIIATNLGIMDFIRRQFAQSDDAKRYNLSASDFSFNSTGSCTTCSGKGTLDEDLFFLGEVKKQCPDCNGSRFCAGSLKAQWMGRNVAEWLSTTIDECLSYWDPFPAARKQLRFAADIGLGYLTIGTPTSELSGGELQRLRIASALSAPGKKMFCLLDEPTRGLSEADIGNLLQTILRLTGFGHTFVVVEHHELFCEKAHQHIVMGPHGGSGGGRIVQTLVRLENSN